MSSTEHDYDWLAFLYVAGEMSAAEGAAFEEQLAQDQSAREALARTMQLTGAVRAACGNVPVPVVSVSFSRRWLCAAAGCAVAALVLVSFSIGLFDRGERQVVFGPALAVSVTKEPSRSQSAGSLVAFWTEASPRRSEVQDDAHLAFADFDSTCVACLDTAELSVPSWMLAAVAGDPQLNHDQRERHEDN